MDTSNKEIQYKLCFIESSLNPRSTCNRCLSRPTLHIERGTYLPYFTTVPYKAHSSASQSEDDSKPSIHQRQQLFKFVELLLTSFFCSSVLVLAGKYSPGLFYDAACCGISSVPLFPSEGAFTFGAMKLVSMELKRQEFWVVTKKRQL